MRNVGLRRYNLMQNVVWGVQKAIFQLLAEDSEIISKVKGIYYFVPKDTSFPYVHVENHFTKLVIASLPGVSEVSTYIHIYDNGQTSENTLTLMQHIQNKLNFVSSEFFGLHFVYMRLKYSEISQVENREVYHGKMEFISMVEG